MIMVTGCNEIPTPDPSAIEIVAHRGASYIAPENTLAAVDSAWKKEADAVEVDVHMTQDNKIVVIHDRTTERTTNKDLAIAETSYDSLSLLDAGSWKGKHFQGKGIHLPLLSEVLQTIPSGKRLFIEVKCPAHALPFIQKDLQSTGTSDQVAIIGFNYETMTEAKEMMPDIPVYWVVGWQGMWKDLISKAREGDLDGLGLHHRLIDSEYAREIREAGLELQTWTVNDPERAARLQNMGVQSITTDRPGWLREQLRNMAKTKATASFY